MSFIQRKDYEGSNDSYYVFLLGPTYVLCIADSSIDVAVFICQTAQALRSAVKLVNTCLLYCMRVADQE